MARDDAFYFANGIYAEDLEQLRDILRGIDEVFIQHHITPDQNDFAEWVRHVHDDEGLARKLEKCRSVHQVVEVLNKRLEGGEPHIREEPHSSHEAPRIDAPATPPSNQQQRPAQQPSPPATQPVQQEQGGGETKFYERAYTRDFLFGFLIGVVFAIVIYQLVRTVI